MAAATTLTPSATAVINGLQRSVAAPAELRQQPKEGSPRVLAKLAGDVVALVRDGSA